MRFGSRHAVLGAVLAAAMSIVVAACGDGSDTTTSTGRGTLRLALTDAPGCGYDEVNVTVESSDGVRAPPWATNRNADRRATGEFDDNGSHSHALPGEIRQTIACGSRSMRLNFALQAIDAVVLRCRPTVSPMGQRSPIPGWDQR